jgi:hypothetical protein
MGFRSTAMRLQGGQVLHIPNGYLSGCCISNSGQMKQRRIKLHLDLCPRTPVAVLNVLPSVLKSVVDRLPTVIFTSSDLSAIGPEYSRVQLIYKVHYTLYTIHYTHECS